MPSTRISTGEWARGKEQELIEVVQKSLLEGLKIPGIATSFCMSSTTSIELSPPGAPNAPRGSRSFCIPAGH
jgi:hypothetical protein